MRLSPDILCLPASLLLLIASQSRIAEAIDDNQSALEWPFYLPPHVKYWPEDPPHRRRDLEAISEHLRHGRNPVGVMKMGDDEGEKFYPEYWQFEGELEQSDRAQSSLLRPRDEEEENTLLFNGSMAISHRPPFALHTLEGLDPAESKDLRVRGREIRDAAAALAVLQKRAFQCPGGTSDCSAIGYPNSCCTTGETCYAIEDTGQGPVGCCPSGSSCGGSISTCAAGYTECGSNLGGGCCIPGYACSGVGCVLSSVVTVSTTQTLTNVPSVSSSGHSISTSTIVIVTTTGVVTITPIASTSTDTYTGLQTTLACTNGYSACPVNQGGGCCLSGRICGSLSCPLPSGSTSTSTSATTSIITTTTGTASATGVAPVRPTSETVASTSSTTTAATGTSCPTGFYACSAYYAGGCCRTGRDCQPTSCPPTSSTTIVSAGETIVVPVGTAASTAITTAGSCATGWFSCAASVGGNCCPSGYSCATDSCSSIGATSTAIATKEGTTSESTRPIACKGILGISAALLLILVYV